MKDPRVVWSDGRYRVVTRDEPVGGNLGSPIGTFHSGLTLERHEQNSMREWGWRLVGTSDVHAFQSALQSMCAAHDAKPEETKS